VPAASLLHTGPQAHTTPEPELEPDGEQLRQIADLVARTRQQWEAEADDHDKIATARLLAAVLPPCGPKGQLPPFGEPLGHRGSFERRVANRFGLKLWR
jgi:hypothetical protein